MPDEGSHDSPNNYLSYARSFGIAIVSSALFLAFLAWVFDATRPNPGAHLLTTTVTATTEAFQFVTPDGRDSAWSLPAGEFSVLGGAGNDTCPMQDLETLCSYDENTRLVIEGASEISMLVSPDGRWSLTVAESNGAGTNVGLFDTSGSQLLQSEQLLQFTVSANAKNTSNRLPFVAVAAILGADLHQSSSIEGSDYDFWQPVLLSGAVQMIADNRPGREKYQVLNDRLDSGDVVRIGEATATNSSDGRSAVWGMISIKASDVATMFEVVLHTSLREVSVSRFGAPEGHTIKASNWTILKKWPNGQYAWVAFASLVAIMSFVLLLTQSIENCRTEPGRRSGFTESSPPEADSGAEIVGADDTKTTTQEGQDDVNA